MPRFSVIIPTCNRPQFLADAIASVLAQEVTDLELIIVNDGDPLPNVPDDPRIRHLENARRGAIAARNLGIAEATGDVIAWLDDDDVWHDPHHLSRAGAILQNGAHFTFADGLMQAADGAPAKRFAHDASAATLARDNTILISGVCYLRRLHGELGLFDPALPFYADWDWYLRVARAGHALVRMPHPAVTIRLHAHNTTGRDTLAARQANLDAFAAKHGLGPLHLKTHADFV